MTQPRLFDGEAMTLLGRRERYALKDTHQHIPAQWAWFNPRMADLSTRIGDDAFGLCSDGDNDAMSYFCGIRSAPPEFVPDDLIVVTVPPLRYAAFAHDASVEIISGTIVAALGRWLPAAGLTPLRGPHIPDLVEHYGADFNPQTGLGTMEIWVPVGAAP